MALSPHEAGRELSRLRQMPYGTARTAASEALTDRIEAEGPRDYLPAALLDLVENYVFTDQDDRGFVGFARLLRLWDEDASLFDDVDTANLFWEYKWVAGSLASYPAISIEQAEAFLAEMERRFVVSGKPTSCVAKSRFGWLSDIGSSLADDARQAWQRAGFDEYDDCAACRTGQQVGFLVQEGRYAEAVEVGAGREGTCNREPHSTLVHLALAHTELGQPELAAEALSAARASIGGNHTMSAGSLGLWFEGLCRINRLTEALALLRGDYADFLPGRATPLDQVRMLTHLVAGLAAHADADDAPTGLTQLGELNVRQVREWAHAQAAELAAQFDQRNGNSFFSRQLDRALTATRLDVPAVAPEAPVVAADVVATPASDSPLESAAVDIEDAPETADAYQQAALADEAAGQLVDAGVNYAEAAHLLADTQLSLAHDTFALAVPRLVAGGAEPALIAAVLGDWAPVAADVLDTAGVEHHVVSLIEHLDQRIAAEQSPSDDLAVAELARFQALRWELIDVLARTIASTPPSQRRPGRSAAEAIDLAMKAGEGFAGIGQPYNAAHAFWLAGRLQREAGDVEAAIWALESAYEGFRVAGLPAVAAEAAGDLIEVLRATGQDERATEVARSL
ncbi:MAG: hypothetical protein CVT62_03460 [Actinobacteria bacterium HGW-Actinobacteria-2]|nr:MAG: hypothetical protein CVT62_03460 [Actinobacteria bacterium HGW-Actinobacteria-2]